MKSLNKACYIITGNKLCLICVNTFSLILWVLFVSSFRYLMQTAIVLKTSLYQHFAYNLKICDLVSLKTE